MSRIYGEPVEVWLRDAHPTRFVWRSRLYTITAHLDHWTTPSPQPPLSPETRSPSEARSPSEVSSSSEALDSVEGRGPAPASGPSSTGGARGAGPGAPRETGSGLGAPEAGAGDEGVPEREFWRVEAVAGLGNMPVVYELRHDLRSGAWLLSRAWD